jgi:hypothetical protein
MRMIAFLLELVNVLRPKVKYRMLHDHQEADKYDSIMLFVG